MTNPLNDAIARGFAAAKANFYAEPNLGAPVPIRSVPYVDKDMQGEEE